MANNTEEEYNSYKKFIQALKELIVDYLIMHHNIEDIDDTLEEQIYEYIFDNIEKFMFQIIPIKDE